MSTTELKSIGSRFLAEQDRLKGVPGDDLCAPGYRAYINGNPPTDREGHERMAHVIFGAFPDFHQTVEETVAEGDRVVVRFTARGTHTGDLMGMAPTRKPIEVGGIAIFRVVGGRVAELHEVFDQATMMEQLGAS